MIIIKKKKSNNNKYLIAIAIVFIIMILAIILIIKATNNKENKDNTTSSSNISAEENDEIAQEEIKTLSESARMKRYIGIFFDNIENGDYQAAYDVLNEDFKIRYFSNIEEFKEYVDKYFNPSIMTITYDNMERLGNNKTGNMYILWLTISNIYQAKLAEDEEIEQTNFVIIENDYNNYEMSFSVNEE